MAILGGNLGDAAELDLNKSVAYGDGGGRPFAPIKPGRYTAVIQSLKSKMYNAGYGTHKNTDSADGRWPYMSLTPHIVLMNDNGTTINRQDLTVGVIGKNGKTFRPDGDTSKSSIFGGFRGAQYMLIALGLIGEDGQMAQFDTDHIKNRVVVVNVGLAAYKRGGSEQKTVEELTAKFDSIKPGWTVADLPELMAAFNEEEGLEPDGKNAWHVKNVVTAFYRLDPDVAREKKFSVLGNQVFVNDVDRVEYEALVKGGNKPANKRPSL